jgi:SAM-dependent methyltransferase
MVVPAEAEVERRLQADDIDEWLALWHAEQGPAKPAALDLMAAVIPMASDARVRVLDVCCGPGDVGRAIRARFPKAEVDGVDRDLMLTGLCKVANQRRGMPGQILRRNLDAPGWDADLQGSYDVAAVGNALHWFTLERARVLLVEVLGRLRPGGLFVFMEPVSPMAEVAAAFAAWRAVQPPQHRREDWLAFWSRVNAFLGYDHFDLGARPPTGRIGDGLTSVQWVELVREAGFAAADVLLRDSEKAVVAAWKSDQA